MSLQHTPSKLALQSGKAEAVGFVAFEDELIEAIAEAADTVIEDDGIGGFAVHRRVQLRVSDRTWLRRMCFGFGGGSRDPARHAEFLQIFAVQRVVLSDFKRSALPEFDLPKSDLA